MNTELLVALRQRRRQLYADLGALAHGDAGMTLSAGAATWFHSRLATADFLLSQQKATPSTKQPT